MNTIEITVPIQRKDIDEQAMVKVEAEIMDNEWWISRIQDEEGNDITNQYTDAEIDAIYPEIDAMVNQERSEYIIGSMESRMDR